MHDHIQAFFCCVAAPHLRAQRGVCFTPDNRRLVVSLDLATRCEVLFQGWISLAGGEQRYEPRSGLKVTLLDGEGSLAPAEPFAHFACQVAPHDVPDFAVVAHDHSACGAECRLLEHRFPMARYLHRGVYHETRLLPSGVYGVDSFGPWRREPRPRPRPRPCESDEE